MTNLKRIEARTRERLNVLSGNWAKEEIKFLSSKKFQKALLKTLNKYGPFGVSKWRDINLDKKSIRSYENENEIEFRFHAYTDEEFRKYRIYNLDAYCDGKCTIENVIPPYGDGDQEIDTLDEPLNVTLHLNLMVEEDMEGYSDIPDDYEPDYIDADDETIEVDDIDITYDDFLGKKLREEIETG